jgi:hypothetical protein
MLLQLELDLQMSLKWWILLFYDCINLPINRFHGYQDGPLLALGCFKTASAS